MLRGLLSLLNPIQSVPYFEHYFKTVLHLARSNNKSSSFSTNFTIPTIGRRDSARRRLAILRCVLGCLAVKGLHYVYLSLQPSRLRGSRQSQDQDKLLQQQQWSEAVHFDALRLFLGGAPHMNRMAVMVIWVLLPYFLHRLFLGVDIHLLLVLRRVLVKRRWPYPTLGSVNAHSRHIDTVRKWFVFTLRLTLSQLITFGLVWLFSWAVFAYRFMGKITTSDHHWLQLTIQWAFSQLCGGLGTGLFFVVYTQTVALNFALTATLLTVFRLRMRTLDHFLGSRQNKDTKRITFEYHRYRREYLRVMWFFFRCNRHHGRLFAVFLVTLTPINIGLTVFLLHGSLPSDQEKTILAVFVTYLMYLIFVLHVGFAHCTRLIHRAPVRLWIPLTTTSLALNHHNNNNTGRVLGAHARLRLALDVQAWHVTARYGFTYGVFGLVSLNAFSKFVMLYGRFVLIFYKMIQNGLID